MVLLCAVFLLFLSLKGTVDGWHHQIVAFFVQAAAALILGYTPVSTNAVSHLLASMDLRMQGIECSFPL